MNEKAPDVYLFNPTCEYAVANGNISWQPKQLLQRMESELATLPLFIAQPKDFVLVDVIPSDGFIRQLSKLNVSPCRFIQKQDALHNPEFLNISKGKLLPWGWSPAAHRLLAPLKPSCSLEFQQSPVSSWKPEYRVLYSKQFARKILHEISGKIDPDIMLPVHLHPQICTTQTEIENLLNHWKKLMVKAPWGSSGRGLQPITKTPVHPKVWEKLMGMVNEQGYVMVEPLLNKLLDLALQFELKNKKVKYLGISRFSADKNGQYRGNFLNGFPGPVAPEVITLANSLPRKVTGPLVNAIEKSELAGSYEGFFGVDMLIFLDKKKRLRINPCLEINVRQNMGLLSLQLEKLLLPNRAGMFRTFYQPAKTYFSFKKEMEKKHPLKFCGHQIESGFLSLTDANKNTSFGAYILV